MAVFDKETLKTFFENGDNPLGEDFANLIDSLMYVNDGVKTTDSTAGEIRSKSTAGTLIPGMTYRIPFQTKHLIPNTEEINTGIAETLLIYAVSDSAVSKRVFSVDYPQDLIYLDIEDVLCEDESTSREGKITYRKDFDKNLETWYDFRNVKFRRWQIDTASNTAWQPSTNYNEAAVIYYSTNFYRCQLAHTSGTTFDDLYWQRLFYEDTSVKLAFNTSMYFGNAQVNANSSVYEDFLTFSNLLCRDISIGKMEDSSYNNIVFLGNSSFDFGNTFQGNCKNISMGNGVSKNSLGENCSNIILYANCNSNGIENDCSGLFIDGGSHNNRIGVNTQGIFMGTAMNNLVENNVLNSTLYSTTYCVLRRGSSMNKLEYGVNSSEIGLNAFRNIIANGLSNAKIGANSYDNIFMNGASDCEVGESAFNNFFTNGSSANKLGNNCSDNTMTDTSKYNILGDGCTNNSFSGNSNYNILGNMVSECMFFYGASFNVLEGDCSGNTISKGNWNRLGKGASFNVFVGAPTETVPSNYNTIGSNSSYNELKGGNNGNRIGNCSSYNQFGLGSSYNELSNNCNYNNFLFKLETPSGAYSNNQLGPNCSNNLIRGNNIVFESGCESNELAVGSYNIYYGPGVKSKIFTIAQSNLRIELGDTAARTYTGAYPDCTVDKRSPDGELWYDIIDSSGAVTYGKLGQNDPPPPSSLIQTLQINLGATSEAGWNEVTTNLTAYSLDNTDGTGSGCTILSTAFSLNGTNGASPDSGTGYNLPDSVMETYFFVGATARDFTFTGNAGKVYDIILFGSRAAGVFSSKITQYTINGVDKTLECCNNTSNTVSFESVPLDGSNQITITVAKTNDAGYINALIIKEYNP